MANLVSQADLAYNIEPDPESLSLLQGLKKGELLLEPITLSQTQGSLEEWREYLHPARHFEIDSHSYYYSLFPINPKHLENYLVFLI